MKYLLNCITACLFMACISTGWALDTKQKLEIIASDANCSPLYCNCLPPKTPRDKACSSRTPDKECQDTNVKLSCEEYCMHVPNCQTKLDSGW